MLNSLNIGIYAESFTCKKQIFSSYVAVAVNVGGATLH